MRLTKNTVRLGAVLSVLVLAAGCGSGSASTGSAEISPSLLASAKANLAPYTGHPSAFPVNEPLPAKPKSGSTMAFLQCSTPFCASLSGILTRAAKTLGVPLTVVKAGASAQDLQTALASIIAKKPAAVLLPAADPVQYRDQMEQLDSLGIPVLTTGIVNGDEFPAIKGGVLGPKASTLAGKLLADWTVVRNGGAPSVFYTIPELSFSGLIEKGYLAEMRRLCPSCDVRVVKIPVATVGNTAPNTVVSDLQANPGTKTAVFGAEQVAEGLPAALDVAGIKVDTTGFAPTPAVLEYIKQGKITSGIAYDSTVSSWMQVDMAARSMAGAPLTAAERNDELVYQVVSSRDITMDISSGFNAYPDVAARFAKLWSGPNAG